MREVERLVPKRLPPTPTFKSPPLRLHLRVPTPTSDQFLTKIINALMSIDVLQSPLRACPLLSEAKFKYRTKFEVHACEWNPTMELLALASRKGEVMVKRCGWKTGWKRDFSKDASLRRWRELFLSDTNETGDSTNSRENALTTVCWSPDGQCLAVAFDSRRVYFLDAQNGRSLYAKRFENKPIRLKWIKLVGEEHVPSTAAVPPADAFAALDTSSTKEHAAQMADLEAFTSRMLPDSLHNTVLHVSSSTDIDIVIDLYAGGLLHLARLDITATLQSLTTNALLIDPTSVELLDFGPDVGDHLHAVVKYCAQSREGGGLGWFTSVLQWRLGMVGRRHELRLVMAAMGSLAEMSYCSAYVREMFEVVGHDWKAQSEAFSQRVLSNLVPSSPTTAHSCQPYQDFFLLLTTGRMPESMREYLQNDSTLKDLKLASGFVDDYYPLLAKVISTHLRPTAEYLARALVTFKSAMVNLFELMAEGRENCALRFFRTLQKIQKHDKAKDTIDWELEERSESEKRLLLVVARLESALKSLTALLTNMERSADENREELSELLRWLSSQCARFTKELEGGGGDGDDGEKAEGVGEDPKTDPTEQLRLVKFFSKASGLYPASSNNLRNELNFLDAWRSHTLSAQTVAAPLQLDRVLPLVTESFPSAMRECMNPLLEFFHKGIHTAIDGELGGTAEIVHVEALHPEGLSTAHLLFSGVGSSPPFLATLRAAGSELSFYRVGPNTDGVAECVRTISGGMGIKVLDQSLQPGNDSTSLFGLLKTRRGGEEATEGPFVFRASVGDAELEMDLTSNLLDSPAYVKMGSRLALVMDASRVKLVWATLNDAKEINEGEGGLDHCHCDEVDME